MRRTHAPSQTALKPESIPNSHSEICNIRRTHVPSHAALKPTSISVKKGSTPFPEAIRSTDELLNLLTSPITSNSIDLSNETHPEPPETKNAIVTNESMESYVQDAPFKRRLYNVVWAKQTKKKHKIWEGDGTVEISNDTAILKDEQGVVLGRSSQFKMILEEGTRAFIGSKEIEVIDIINEQKQEKNIHNPKKENHTSQYIKNIRRLTKKPRLDRAFSVPLAGDNHKLLVMPRPNYTHQCKYNLEELPIHDVKLDLFLSRILRDHQQQGVLFLYSCVTEIRNEKCSGAILADEMGLGKTLQCISLIWIILKQGPYGGLPTVQRILIVTPSSLVTNWLKEFKKWLGFERLRPFIINQKQNISEFVNSVPTKNPVLIISYEMLVRQYDALKKCKFQLLICDEGHRLKNNQIKVSQQLSQLNIKRRIILTGTPVQNNLQEFFSLVDFVNPGILGSYQEFKNYFETPVIESQQPGCSKEVKELGDQRAAELHHRTNIFILRRSQSVIDQYLPSKQECVIFCSLSQLQIDLYETVLAYWENSSQTKNVKVPHLSVITILKKICNDPRLVRMKNSLDSVDDDEYENFGTFGEDLMNRLQPFFENFDYKYAHSGKMFILKHFFADLKDTGEKVVLVSYFTQTLDLLQDLCKESDYNYLRLDGTTPAATRSEVVDKFNAPNSKYFVFLLSAKAGGVGLNLVGSSRLVLFDLDWNPASDLQAMSRIWRDGQKKNVYIYRFLATGSIEEKIYQRQISKTFLSDAVMDVNNDSSTRMSTKELKDLLAFKPHSYSLTHELLMCECEGCGLPETGISEDLVLEDERTCQLGIANQVKNNSTLKISDLIQWEHYIRPVADDVLEELYLQSASEIISFVFRNKSST